MFNRFAYFAAVSAVLAGGCDVYREVLEKGAEGQQPLPGKAPPPPPAAGGEACGCGELARSAYDSCMANVKDLFAQGGCGSRYQDIAISCLESCKDTPCAATKGTGFYKFGSAGGAHGHTPDITCNQALANCLLNSDLNEEAWQCTWNDIDISVGGAKQPPQPAGAGVDVFCDGDYKPEVETFGASRRGRVDIVRIYESRGDHHGSDYHPMGDVKVSLDNPDTTDLVVSSYEPTRWHVGGPGPTALRRIIVTGYQEQDVVAPAGVLIERHVGPSDWWELSTRGGPSGKENIIRAATEATNLKPTTVSYCYRANAFSLR